MTRTDLQALVEFWRLRLAPEWRIKLMDEPPEDEEGPFFAISQVPAPDYTEMVVHFPDSSLDRPDVLIEQTVVHEILHSLAREMTRRTLDELDRYVAPNVHEDAVDRARAREETFVDRIARSIVAIQRDKPTLLTGTRSGNGTNWSHDERVLA